MAESDGRRERRLGEIIIVVQFEVVNVHVPKGEREVTVESEPFLYFFFFFCPGFLPSPASAREIHALVCTRVNRHCRAPVSAPGDF